jgi:hypothetical protein
MGTSQGNARVGVPRAWTSSVIASDSPVRG